MRILRALVIDDAVMMRKLISTALEGVEGIEVAGVAANGRIGLEKLTQIQPDFVTLDVEMPEMGGLETLRRIRATHPMLPVIMVSTATSRGAVVTLDALAAGASDYITKPVDSKGLEESIVRLRDQLVSKVRALCKVQPVVVPPRVTVPPLPPRTPRPRIASGGVDLLCIGTSTGGPNALAEVFSRLQIPLPVPVAIVQHMPPAFTQMLAERLDRAGGATRCKEAEDGEILQKGVAYMAPGGRHLAIEEHLGNLRSRILDTPPENSCRPAVDVLFRSAAQCVGGRVLAVVLTGMGSDGMLGARQLVDAGGRVIAQDEASSVVWGMPGSVVHAGLAADVLPLDQIPGAISRRLGL